MNDTRKVRVLLAGLVVMFGVILWHLGELTPISFAAFAGFALILLALSEC